MLTKDLVTLIEELRRRAPREIEIEQNPDRLRLSLDKKTGLEEYEEVSLSPSNVGQENYSMKMNYTGMFGSAFDTFLTPKYSRWIEKSKALARLRSKVEALKEDKKVEIFDKETQEFYSRLVTLEENISLNEAERVVNYFFNVFKEKAEN
ncbi:MAG: hypothetical protein QXD13_01555 [Candidatus Pacearchaeota archaeon]